MLIIDFIRFVDWYVLISFATDYSRVFRALPVKRGYTPPNIRELRVKQTTKKIKNKIEKTPQNNELNRLFISWWERIRV